jgi:hypothetical protein
MDNTPQEFQMHATFPNLADNMVATVTPIERGYAVTLIDCDSQNIVATRIYPKDKNAQAIAYARELAFGKNELIGINL